MWIAGLLLLAARGAAAQEIARDSAQTAAHDIAAQQADTLYVAAEADTQDTQDTLTRWTLHDCLEYALENNISLRQGRNNYLSGVEDTKQARAAQLPSLAASTTQGFTNYPSSNVDDNNSYTATYGVNAEMTLYAGGQLRTAVKQQLLQNDIDALTVSEAENDIRVAIVQAYLQTLYAAEAVTIAESTAEISRAQCDRAAEMKAVGSISRVDLAQFESQYASDRYQVTVARTALDDYRLQLKQLLELDIDDEMQIATPVIAEEEVLAALPSKAEIYDTVLGAMPEIERGRLDIAAAELGVKQARAGYLPTLALTAGIGSGYMSGNSAESGSQIWNRFNENIGLTLSIPLFSNRRNRTAVNKARLEVNNAQLAWQDLRKTLLRKVETAWLDAVSAQSQYVAAGEKERYARESFELTDQQFAVGMKNVVELLTAQNEYAAARQEVLQAKYLALMNIELLNIYQGREVTSNY